MKAVPRDDAERVLLSATTEIGDTWLRKRLAEKLTAAGVDPKPKLLTSLVAQIRKPGATEGTFLLEAPDDSLPSNITLEFTDEDLADLDQTIERFNAQLPGLLAEFTDKESRSLFKTLKGKWPEEHALQQQEMSEFRERLEERWGEGLTLLRMLLTVAREIGGQRLAYDLKTGKDRRLRQVLSRLHARACQIMAEIIVLLENGFADGAMARWRTMHEISVVATVVAEGGDDLAELYVQHQKVEAKRALEDYEQCHADIGYRPMPKADVKRILKAFDEVIARYGSDFAKPYGWAAGHLRKLHGLKPKQQATFGDLQDAARRGMMQSHFRMASHNVHAGPHGIYFKLGQMGYSEILLAGASNAGLVEPAQNAALTLTQVTALLFPAKPSIFDLIGLKTFARIREAIPAALARADAKLKRDHEAFEKQGEG